MTTASTRRASTVLRGDRARAVRRRLGRRAGDGPVRRRAFAVAERSAAAARGRDRAFRREGHADRLRHHGRAAHPGRPPARPRAVRRQSRPERRRGRDLFGHRGRAPSRRTILGIPRLRAVAGLWADDAAGPALGMRRGSMAPGIIRKVIAEGIPPHVLVNINFPDCEPDDVKGVAVGMQGRAHAGPAAHRRAHRRTRQPVFLDRLRARRVHARATART